LSSAERLGSFGNPYGPKPVHRVPVAPPVGIVIANYNNADFVKDAMASAACQSVRDIQVVVVDDASTDDSDAIVRRYLTDLGDERFRYIQLASNLGQTGAIRRGLAELDTPLVCFLDADDILHEEFVARHVAAHMNADFPVALTFCDSHIVDVSGHLAAGTAWWFDYSYEPRDRPIDPSHIPTIEPKTGKLTYPSNKSTTLLGQWSIDAATNSMTGMMIRRSFVDLVLTPSDDDLRFGLDFYLSTFAWLLTGVIAIHEPLYDYRMHGKNQYSNGAILGGTYNSSTRSWKPIRDSVLQLIETVLRQEAGTLRAAFGDFHYSQAEATLRKALHPESSISLKRLLTAVGDRVSRLTGSSVPTDPSDRSGG
jgi:glycosyltransferase involved in cell wall biosynthesis